MSKIRDLPELTTLSQDDIVYAVDEQAGTNGGRKTKISTIKTAVELTNVEIKTKYELNADTNAFTDAEKTKLISVETGATADQIASEIPYSNSVSGLSATTVQAAIDEINAQAPSDFLPSISAGRVLHYTGGNVRFDGVLYQIVSNDILLNQNITSGEVYVDSDGIIKQTGSGISAPPYTVVFAKFSTDLNSITSLIDVRVKNSQNIARGLIGDIQDISAGSAGSAGNSGKVSDASHKHNILTANVSTQVPDQANSEGSSTALARADHIHEFVTAAPITTLSPSVSNAQGAATSLSRSDHTHSVATALVGDITTIQPDDSSSAGTADTYARGDHKHGISAAAPSNTGTSNAEGSATSFARADHIHNTVVSNYTASATADDTTLSATDVLIDGMTITPAAGTYLALFSTSVTSSGNSAIRMYFSIYSAGSQVAHSQRVIGITNVANVSVYTQAIVTVNGSQAIEAMWRAAAGQNTAHERSLILIRLG